MLAHTLYDLLQKSNIKCYIPKIDQTQLGDELIYDMQNVTKAMDERGSSFLLGEEPCFADFQLYEICERVEFFSDGKLLAENVSLLKHHHNVGLLPNIREYLESDAFKQFPFNNKAARINNEV